MVESDDGDKIQCFYDVVDIFINKRAYHIVFNWLYWEITDWDAKKVGNPALNGVLLKQLRY